MGRGARGGETPAQGHTGASSASLEGQSLAGTLPDTAEGCAAGMQGHGSAGGAPWWSWEPGIPAPPRMPGWAAGHRAEGVPPRPAAEKGLQGPDRAEAPAGLGDTPAGRGRTGRPQQGD